MSIPCLVIIRTRFSFLYQHVDGLCDLDPRQIDLKINRDHLHSNTDVCAKFYKPMSILCLVIIQSRFGLYINMLAVTVTLTFDQLTSKSIRIIYIPRAMYVPCMYHVWPRSILCLVNIWTRKGPPTDWQTDRLPWATQYTPTSLKGGHKNCEKRLIYKKNYTKLQKQKKRVLNL